MTVKFIVRIVAVLALWALPLLADRGFVLTDRSHVAFISSKATKDTNWYTLFDNTWGTYVGTNLGTYAPASGEALILHAFDTKTCGTPTEFYTTCVYFYAVYPTNQRPANPTFTSMGGSLIADLGGDTQQWGRSTSDPVNENITATPGLSNGAAYTLEILGYCSNETDGAYVVEGIGGEGERYIAQFTMAIPEPVVAVAIMGLLLAFRRR